MIASPWVETNNQPTRPARNSASQPADNLASAPCASQCRRSTKPVPWRRADRAARGRAAGSGPTARRRRSFRRRSPRQVGAESVERKVATGERQSVPVRFDDDRAAVGPVLEEPQAVIGPTAADLDHRGELRQPADEVVEGEFLLRLVMAAASLNQLRHPRPAIAVGDDFEAVVHALNALAVLVGVDCARAGDLRDSVGVAPRRGHLDALIQRHFRGREDRVGRHAPRLRRFRRPRRRRRS